MSVASVSDAIELLRAVERRGSLSTSEARAILGCELPRARSRRALRSLEQLGYVRREGSGRRTRYLGPGPASGRAEPTVGDLFALVVAERMLAFLRGTDVETWVEGLASRLLHDATRADRQRAETFSRRFVLLEEPPRLFAGVADRLDAVLSSVLQSHVLRVRFEGTDLGEVQPLALALYRRALYLLAVRPGDPRVLRLAVDRIDEVGTTRISFARPDVFDPMAELAPWFGIRAGDAVRDVRIRFDPAVARYVRARRWHGTALVRPAEDGRIELSMRTGGPELVRFVLEWGERAEAMEPPELRRDVVAALRAALSMYETPCQEAAPGAVPSETRPHAPPPAALSPQKETR